MKRQSLFINGVKSKKYNDCFWLPEKVDVTIKDSESYMPSEV